MCYQIEAEFVLANHFSCSSDPLTFGELRKIRVAIESKFNGQVYVDVSTPSLASAVEMYPKMFRWDGDEIAKCEDSDSQFDEENGALSCFGYGLEESIRQQAREEIVRLCV